MTMPRKSSYSEFSNEELILEYALRFDEETKKAFVRERQILSELVDRGIIDKNAMNELYKKKALCPVL